MAPQLTPQDQTNLRKEYLLFYILVTTSTGFYSPDNWAFKGDPQALLDKIATEYRAAYDAANPGKKSNWNWDANNKTIDATVKPAPKTPVQQLAANCFAIASDTYALANTAFQPPTGIVWSDSTEHPTTGEVMIFLGMV